MIDSKTAIRNQLSSLGLSANFCATMLEISPASLSGYFSSPRDLPRAIEHQLRNLILSIEALKVRTGALFPLMSFNGNFDAVRSILQKIEDGHLEVFVKEFDPNTEAPEQAAVPEKQKPAQADSETGLLKLEPKSPKESTSALASVTVAVNSK